MIKIISYPSSINTEEAFNTWLEKNIVAVKLIQYSTVCCNGEIWHSIMIYYE